MAIFRIKSEVIQNRRDGGIWFYSWETYVVNEETREFCASFRGRAESHTGALIDARRAACSVKDLLGCIDGNSVVWDEEARYTSYAEQ